MKRHISWDLYICDVDHFDKHVCAATFDEEDPSEFLEKFVDLCDFGFECFLKVNVWYTKEDVEK